MPHQCYQMEYKTTVHDSKLHKSVENQPSYNCITSVNRSPALAGLQLEKTVLHHDQYQVDCQQAEHMIQG